MAKVAHLLESIVPEHYRINLDIDTAKFKFRGLEEIDFNLKTANKSLTFHAKGLNVTLAELDSKAKATDIAIDDDQQTVTLTFESEILAGDHTLSLAFAGAVNETLRGFYRSRYELNGREQWLFVTQHEAVHARESIVCIDEPSAKAVFELSLMVPDELTALSNTEVVSEAPSGDGRKKVAFAPTPKMSTYLLAFIVGALEHVEQTTPEGVTIRIFATPGRMGELAYALEVGVRTLSFYDQYFGIPYPLQKLDMVALPDFAAGAMENWGLVTYRETALLIDPAKASLSNKQRVAEVITHELAHQWFGNLVTMKWWNDLWLNEGFASWMESYAKDHLFPEWLTWTEFMQTDFAYSMELDGLANTHPIEVEVDDPRSLDEIFDAVSYYKGSSIINMLHHFLGEADFRAGLQEYLKRHSYGNTTTHDLWQSLGRASGKPVDELMSAWTTQPGYPIVAFNNGEVSQQRFLSSPREAAKAKLDTAKLWPIPFSVRTPSGEESPQLIFDSVSMRLPTEATEGAWFKPNPGQTSFYRTLYNEEMIDTLTEPLRAGQLKATDRFGIVNDVFATTEAGQTNSVVALKLVEALRNETDYVVWSGLTGGFAGLSAIVEDQPLRDALEEFGGWLTGPNVERLGWEPKPDESTFDTLLRPLVLQQAVRFDNKAVTHEAKQRFKTYLEGGTLDPDLRPVALYAAARHGGTEEFDAILERYLKEDSPQVKISLLSALGRFRKTAEIKRFLALGLSDDVRPQDIYIVLAWGFRNRHGRDLTWQWVKDNWAGFVRQFGGGGHMLERYPLYAASGFATHKMAAEIKQFFTENSVPTTVRPTAQAAESIEIKADWYDRDKLKIQNFIDSWKARR